MFSKYKLLNIEKVTPFPKKLSNFVEITKTTQPHLYTMTIVTPRLSRGFFICGQSPMILASPQGVPYATKCKRLLLVTRKRVYIFFERHLVVDHIFLELVLYVFCYLFSVLSCCIDIISSTPETSVPVLIL